MGTEQKGCLEEDIHGPPEYQEVCVESMGRKTSRGGHCWEEAVYGSSAGGMGSFALQNEIPQDFGHLYLSHSAFK